MTIYFLQMGQDGPVKIGRSLNLDSRLQSYNAILPAAPRCLGIICVPNEFQEERRWHMRFSHLHLRCEWFRPDGELLVAIRAETQPYLFRATKPVDKRRWCEKVPDITHGATRLALWMEEQGYTASALDWDLRIGTGRIGALMRRKTRPDQALLDKINGISRLSLTRDEFLPAQRKAA